MIGIRIMHDSALLALCVGVGACAGGSGKSADTPATAQKVASWRGLFDAVAADAYATEVSLRPEPLAYVSGNRYVSTTLRHSGFEFSEV